MIEQDVLHELFEYRDGVLYWKVNKSNVKAGDMAGCLNNSGYYTVKVNSKQYLIHRLIYLMHYDMLPEFIDHKDNNPLNNRIENLRAATFSQNQHNRKINKNNTSGVKGVCWHPPAGKWVARLTINGKYKHLGLFNNIEEAKKAVEKQRSIHHKEFARND